MWALLRRNGRHYKVETQNKTHWTLHHYCWLDRTIEASSGSLKVNLALLLRQLKGINNILTEYGQQIEALTKTPRYEQLVQALTCSATGAEATAFTAKRNQVFSVA